MANEYSKTWFELFMANKSKFETELEAEFIMRNAPFPNYITILDICCGQGRHTKILVDNGYQVVGIDRDLDALELAKKNIRNKKATFIQQDMRDIESLNKRFNAIISMWQSFGYFDDAVNKNILRQISNSLLEKGIFILDIYNRIYYENSIGISRYNKEGIEIVSEVQKRGDRFNIKLTYDDNEKTIEEFNWKLYTKDEIADICRDVGLVCKIGCTWCDENKPIDNDSVRMQLVFQKQ